MAVLIGMMQRMPCWPYMMQRMPCWLHMVVLIVMLGGLLCAVTSPPVQAGIEGTLTPSNIMIPRGQNLTFQCAPDPEHLPVTHHRLKLHIANKTILPDSNGDFNVQNVSLELSDTYAQCMAYSDNDDDPLTVGQPAYVQVCDVDDCGNFIFPSIIEVTPAHPNLLIGQELTIKCSSDLELQQVNVVLQHMANIPDLILSGPQTVPGEFHISNVTEDMHDATAQCFATISDDGLHFVTSPSLGSIFHVGDLPSQIYDFTLEFKGQMIFFIWKTSSAGRFIKTTYAYYSIYDRQQSSLDWSALYCPLLRRCSGSVTSDILANISTPLYISAYIESTNILGSTTSEQIRGPLLDYVRVGRIRALTGLSVSSNELTLQWKKPRGAQHVELYYFINVTCDWKIHAPIKFSSANATLVYKLAELIGHTDYHITIYAMIENGKLPGDPETINIKTTDSVPLEVPHTDTSAFTRQGRNITVYWQTFNTHLLQGEFNEYQIDFCTHNNNMETECILYEHVTDMYHTFVTHSDTYDTHDTSYTAHIYVCTTVGCNDDQTEHNVVHIPSLSEVLAPLDNMTVIMMNNSYSRIGWNSDTAAHHYTVYIIDQVTKELTIKMTDSEFVVMLMPEFSNVYIAMTTKTGQSTGMRLVPCVYDATKDGGMSSENVRISEHQKSLDVVVTYPSCVPMRGFVYRILIEECAKKAEKCQDPSKYVIQSPQNARHGIYTIPHNTPGNYELSVYAETLETRRLIRTEPKVIAAPDPVVSSAVIISIALMTVAGVILAVVAYVYRKWKSAPKPAFETIPLETCQDIEETKMAPISHDYGQVAINPEDELSDSQEGIPQPPIIEQDSTDDDSNSGDDSSSDDSFEEELIPDDDAERYNTARVPGSENSPEIPQQSVTEPATGAARADLYTTAERGKVDETLYESQRSRREALREEEEKRKLEEKRKAEKLRELSEKLQSQEIHPQDDGPVEHDDGDDGDVGSDHEDDLSSVNDNDFTSDSESFTDSDSVGSVGFNPSDKHYCGATVM